MTDCSRLSTLRFALPSRFALVSFALAAFALGPFTARSAHAAWPHDPNNGNVPVCTAAGNQISIVAVPDGSGGVIVAWQDGRNGTSNYDVYAQRISAAGVPLWTPDGVVVCAAANNQITVVATTDGAGGAIITWQDNRNAGVPDIYAQRVNASGTPQWTPNGVIVCNATNGQLGPVIASDGAGGAIIGWTDGRSGISNDLYAQRVNSSGGAVWLANGVPVSAANGDQALPVVVSDGAHSAVFAWEDLRGPNYDIYAQRLDPATGAPLWTLDGLPICLATADQTVPSIAADGTGGAIVAWQDLRTSALTDIYAQRVIGSGIVGWTTDGVSVASAPDHQLGPKCVSDGAGGAIVCWQDMRNSSFADIYAQRMLANGSPAWAVNGVAISTAAGAQQTPLATSDGAGGAIIGWVDSRNGTTTDNYGQRVSGSGAPLWAVNGVAICTAVGGQTAPVPVTDGNNGAIFAWGDSRSFTGLDVYAQRVERDGKLGNPEPAITSVRDVANDQGGQIKVTWDASYLDANPAYEIGSYWVWRSVPTNLATFAAARGATLLSERDVEALRARHVEPARGQLRLASGDASALSSAWEFVGSQAGRGFATYSLVVPTTGDSIAGSNPFTGVLVEANSDSSSAFWDSAPDSGYSVDNLGPATPAPFVGAYSGGATHLHWGANLESDLAGYRLYRGVSAGFVPGPGNLVTAQPDTGFNDAGAAGSYYKLSAVDVHGNESGFALLTPGGTTAVPGGRVASGLWLAQAVPNPARAASLIRFGLPAEGRVTLAVFDQQGRRVRTLAGGTLPAGDHAVSWDGRDDGGREVAAGLYFYRLEAGGRSLVERLAMVR